MKSSEIFSDNPASVAIIGGGPAGLMAAEVIAQAGFSVSVFDAMPSLGRKFLLAGVGGMNITHSEEPQKFLTRYAPSGADFTSSIQAFDAQALQEWVNCLGIETFVGSSGRVFPKDMKAAPLLRAWLHRLRELGVKFYPRHQWLGWTASGDLHFFSNARDSDKSITTTLRPDATVLALGGASWPRLGSTGAWVSLLRERGVTVAELQPSNCGFDIAWSEFIHNECAGEHVKTVSLSVRDYHGNLHCQRGECVITNNGIEGGAVYGLSRVLREMINVTGQATLVVDLLPDLTEQKIFQLLKKPRGKTSVSNFLRKQLKLPNCKIHLLRELTAAAAWQDEQQLAAAIKHLPLILTAPRPIGEAISSAGGVTFAALTSDLMLKAIPGVFCAGEMLDWEAPTGGYLLTACFATGRTAGLGAIDWLQHL